MCSEFRAYLFITLKCHSELVNKYSNCANGIYWRHKATNTKTGNKLRCFLRERFFFFFCFFVCFIIAIRAISFFSFFCSDFFHSFILVRLVACALGIFLQSRIQNWTENEHDLEITYSQNLCEQNELIFVNGLEAVGAVHQPHKDLLPYRKWSNALLAYKWLRHRLVCASTRISCSEFIIESNK